MRLLALSIGTCLLVLGAVRAQNGDGGGTMQLPVGQTFKNPEFPIYQDGLLKATVTAVEATGITLNRADTSDLKIELYENGALTTTITSPKADLYVAERKMRTKNTVRIVRTDSDTTAQNCDFDLMTKKYLLRTNVKVILKNFDLSTTPAGGSPATPSSPPPRVEGRPPIDSGPLLESPAAYAGTNSAPIPPTSSETK